MVILIPFPFSDLPAPKNRPVLVLTRLDRDGEAVRILEGPYSVPSEQ